jgi:hypothetical protein
MINPLWITGIPILACIFALWFLTEVRGGEITDCADRHGSGRWIYRIVDEKRCWFPAGRLRRGEEKPLEELRWPSQPIIQTAPAATPEAPKIRPEPTEFERRFHGDIH